MKLLRIKTDGGARWVTVEEGLARSVDLINGEAELGPKLGDIDRFELLPVVNPSKVIGIGLNYEDHASETDAKLPQTPLSFAIYPSAIVGHEQAIRIPDGVTEVDYEAELGVVIGKKCRDVSVEGALACVFAYTCVNDISARDIQMSDGQWTRGKSFDSFSPVGPCLVTKDDIPDPQRLVIMSRVDGEVRQNSSTELMVFSVAEIIRFISRSTTLLPGDLIATGTPSGVALGQADPPWLTPGSIVEVEIESIGILRNYVVGSNGAAGRG